jgi:(heptosyl)LPS beta-1,4-glucosyltransferase
MPLTVVIPSKNEETDLPRTLSSLSWADEILVIDTGSQDNTIALAKKAGARVIQETFVNFKQIRNLGDQKAKNDWILSIDADVVVTPELALEIQSVIRNEPGVYKIGRINIIFGKPILHSDWGPRDDNHIRLYHRSLGSWSGRVHEQFQTKDKVNPKQLKHNLIHYNYETVEEFVDKINFYSDLEIQRRRQRGESFSFVKMIWEAKRDFFKRYIYKLGFLDGDHGFFLAYLQALYYLSVQIKLYTKT